MTTTEKCAAKFCRSREIAVKVHDQPGDAGYYLCQEHFEDRQTVRYAEALKRLGGS